MKVGQICIILFLIGCTSAAVINKKPEKNVAKCPLECNNALLCYKYLYNDDSSFALNEKTFWIYGNEYNEFSYKKIDASFEDISKSVKTLEKRSNLKDFIYTYAFVNNCKDTIYADYSLNRWVIKKGGVLDYYEYDDILSKNADTLNTKGLKIYDKFFKY